MPPRFEWGRIAPRRRVRVGGAQRSLAQLHRLSLDTWRTSRSGAHLDPCTLTRTLSLSHTHTHTRWPRRSRSIHSLMLARHPAPTAGSASAVHIKQPEKAENDDVSMINRESAKYSK